MKNKLLTVLITSLVMIGALGGFVWKMHSLSEKITGKEEKAIEQEKDINRSGKELDKIDPLKLNTLYLKGDKKNVVTRKYTSIRQVYKPLESSETEQLLTDIKKKGEYTSDRPLWAYNPYGTNESALYVYFRSEGKCYCRYTISVDNDKIPDFTRTLSNGASGNVSEEHEYQLIGLVPGETNYIILRLYNSKDELSKTMYYKIRMPKGDTGAQTILDTETGNSKTEINNGLYTVFQKDVSSGHVVNKIVTKKVKKGKKKITKKVKKRVKVRTRKYAVLLYDNSGVLRSVIPTINSSGYNAQIIYDNLVYSCAKDEIAQINSLGQVMSTTRLIGYKQSGEFAYDGAGNLYVIASAGNTISSRVLKIVLETGEVSEALKMEDVLPTVYQKALKKSAAKAKHWITLNSVQVAGTNQLLVSSAVLSSIFKISNAGSLMPKVDYIIADKKLWKDYKKLKKKVLTKAMPADASPTPEATQAVESILETKVETPDVFLSQYGQNAIVRETEDSLTDGQYYLYMLNNNAGRGAAASQNSYYYKYLVDENAGTYILSEKQRLSRSTAGGNVVPLEEGWLETVSKKGRFLEVDPQGKTIRTFQIKGNLRRVYKTDWKGFWFY